MKQLTCQVEAERPKFTRSIQNCQTIGMIWLKISHVLLSSC